MAKKQKRHFRVAIAYPSNYYPELDEKLEDRLGVSDGAGMGFGNRDMDWCFGTQEIAHAAIATIKRFRRVTSIIFEILDENYDALHSETVR